MAEEMKKVVMSQSAGIPNGTILRTSEGMPDLVVKSRPWWLRTLIRVGRIFLVTFTGMLPIVMGNLAPDYLRPPADLWDKLVLTAGFSLSPSIVLLLANATEWLVREDSR